MPINLRGSATVADGSVTTAKLADGAVTTAKIVDSAVSIAKVSTEVATESFFGAEQTISNTGNVETSVADFNFIKASDTTSNWQKFSYKTKLNSDNVSNTATLKVYIDTVLIGSGVTTTSITPVVLSEVDLDISALSVGSHHVEFKLNNSDVAGITTLTQVDTYLAKK